MKQGRIEILCLLFILLSAPGYAQHKPQYSQYQLNNYLINPAITGIERYADIKTGYRSQWSSIKGSPETCYLSGHIPFYSRKYRYSSRMPRNQKNKFEISNERLNNSNKINYIRNRHGIGIILSTDKTGSYRRYNTEISYAYHQKLFKKIFASVGFSVGYLFEGIEISSIDVIDNADLELIDEQYKHNFDISSGLLVYGDKFYAGISVCQLLRKEPRFLNSGNVNETNKQFNYFAMGAYLFNITSEVVLIPSFGVKYLYSTDYSYDAGMRCTFRSKYWAGAIYRKTNTYAFFVGMGILPCVELTYSYDLGSNNLDYYSGGSSEIMIGVRLNSKLKNKCPKFW